jgi:hypothetical protein
LSLLRWTKVDVDFKFGEPILILLVHIEGIDLRQNFIANRRMEEVLAVVYAHAELLVQIFSNNRIIS